MKVRTVRVQIGGVPVARRRKQSIPLKHGLKDRKMSNVGCGIRIYDI
jgi:hypothetical protein